MIDEELKKSEELHRARLTQMKEWHDNPFIFETEHGRNSSFTSYVRRRRLEDLSKLKELKSLIEDYLEEEYDPTKEQDFEFRQKLICMNLRIIEKLTGVHLAEKPFEVIDDVWDTSHRKNLLSIHTDFHDYLIALCDYDEKHKVDKDSSLSKMVGALRNNCNIETDKTVPFKGHLSSLRDIIDGHLPVEEVEEVEEKPKVPEDIQSIIDSFSKAADKLVDEVEKPLPAEDSVKSAESVVKESIEKIAKENGVNFINCTFNINFE